MWHVLKKKKVCVYVCVCPCVCVSVYVCVHVCACVWLFLESHEHLVKLLITELIPGPLFPFVT